ncbi:MAG: 1,4-alpha-glucan branching protein GlgB, partial [Sphingobacteriaceae bacterium]
MAKQTKITDPEATVAKPEKVKRTPEPKAAPTAAKEAEVKPVKTTKKAVAKPAVAEYLNAVEAYSRFTDFDISLFRSGKHYKLYEKFGSHVVEHKGVVGTYFAVWAPNAQYIAVVGNFNGWNRGSHPLMVRWDSSGIWEGFIPHVGVGETYKYFIKASSGEELVKSDPFALRWELPPHTASIVADTYYE